MKKIVSNTIIVGSQLLVGGLFLVMLFTGKPEDNMVVVVENSNMNKMADVVSSLFVANTEVVDETVVEELKSEEEIKKEKELQEQEELRKKEEEAKAKEQEKAKEEEEKQQQANDQNNNAVSNPDTSDVSVIATYYGSLTGYGPDCYGCSGFTSSGHNANASYTYDDSQYGTIRIIAADPSIPLYSVFRITIPGSDPFLAIVLDRGGNVGFDRGTLFDLLFPTESQAMHKTDNVMFEQLR